MSGPALFRLGRLTGPHVDISLYRWKALLLLTLRQHGIVFRVTVNYVQKEVMFYGENVGL